MPGQDAELAVGSVDDQEARLPLEEARLDRDHPQIEGHQAASGVRLRREAAAEVARMSAVALLLHLVPLLTRLVDRADHVEGLLREVVVLALEDLEEAAHRLL